MGRFFAIAALALLAFVRVRPLTQLVEPSPQTWPNVSAAGEDNQPS